MVEILLKNQLLDYIEEISFFNDAQYGFRHNRNTTSLLIGLTDTIRQNLSRDKCSLLLLMDLTKAFDKVDYSVLISKLSNHLGLSFSSCKLLHSYLYNRYQYVSVGEKVSHILPVRSGVPQGSVLGPILFNIYLNDIFSIFDLNNSCIPFAYADDLFFLFIGERQFMDVMQQLIKYTVSNINNWMNNNKLIINASKTKAMFFGSPLVELSININNIEIQYVDHIKCLGLLLDNKLNFDRHINFVISRVNYTLRRIYNVNLILPFNIKIMIIHSLVLPIFLYGIEVYSGTFGYNIQILSKLFNKVIRYLYCLRRHNHVSMYVCRFLRCSFLNFIKFRLLFCFYKLFSHGNILYINSLFTFNRSIRNRQIQIPRLTSVLERSFHIRVARIYNNLPSHLKTFNLSLDAFKTKTFNYLENNSL